MQLIARLEKHVNEGNIQMKARNVRIAAQNERMIASIKKLTQAFSSQLHGLFLLTPISVLTLFRLCRRETKTMQLRCINHQL